MKRFGVFNVTGWVVLSVATCLKTAWAGEPPDYRAEAERAIDAFDATGLVATVMIDGDIVYLDAFGKANEVTDAPVTTDMLFPIASISKAFTATALAILVDRGLVEWDAPIKTYIPEFEMYDPWVTENFSVRDALTHRSGLPLGAGDLLFWPDGEGSLEDVLKALPHLKPTTGFRSEYAYDNLLYVVAGDVVTRASGKNWDEFVTKELFKPLGMKNCAANGARIKRGKPVVTGHERSPGDAEGTPMSDLTKFPDWLAPAGGIYCPAGDMMKWAQFWFDGGLTQKGKRLLSEEQVREVWEGVTPIKPRAPVADSKLSNLALYALGWRVLDFDGSLLVEHSGGAPGVASNFILLPEKKAAIFASSNDYRQTAHAWTYQIADMLIDGQDADLTQQFGDGFAAQLDDAKDTVSSAAEPPEDAAAPTLGLAEYAGVYRDAWYGDVTITNNVDGLAIDMSRSELLDGPLSHYDGDQFVAFWPDRTLKADAFVNFVVEDGVVTGMTMKAVSDITDFSYDFHHLDLKRVRASAE
ncbi:MAG: serine hydrolase [Pseudomonadota bacterium]